MLAQRFEEYLKKHEGNAGTDLLKRTYNYMLMEHAADPDELVHEWTESIVGDQYPMPDRILKYTEILVQDYLNQEMCNGHHAKIRFIRHRRRNSRDVLCIRLAGRKFPATQRR